MNNPLATLFRTLAATAALGAMAAAHAGPVTGHLKLTGWANGYENVNVTTPGYSGAAGGFVGTIDFGGGPLPIQVWCFELTQNFSWNTTYDYEVDVAPEPAESLLSGLFQSAYGTALTDASHSAAFQLAVWEVRYDPANLDLLSPSSTFHTTRSGNGTDALAQTSLQGFNKSLSGTGNIFLFTNAERQDFVGYLPQTFRVPEPGSLALIAMALGVAWVPGRRRAAASRA
jgi:hypothetical protein